ncbi:malonyl-ACP O-methyltransferase BioC [Limibacter armeniacum]|uniref:malonyl-ACP O-methyltransferase BioC n=1 Tax=Limibacter armeniacum TaxID=466084 RepID=UPI002FE513A8
MVTVSIDKQLVAERFRNNFATYESEAVVQRHMVNRLFGLLENESVKPQRILEIGCGTGFLTKKLKALPFHMYWLNDLVFEAVNNCLSLVDSAFPLVGDIEQKALPEQLDLVASSATFQWIANFPAFAKRLHRHMAVEGVLAFSTFGPANMQEIRALTGAGLDYPCLHELTDMLSPYFEISQAEQEQQVLVFENPIEVLKHLRQTGVTGLSRQHWGKEQLRHFCESYQDRFSIAGGVKLTYEPIYIVAKKI